METACKINEDKTMYIQNQKITLPIPTINRF